MVFGLSKVGFGQSITPVVDTVKPISYVVTIVPANSSGVKKWETGLSSSPVSVELFQKGKNAGISFSFPKAAKVLAKGSNVKESKARLEWSTDLKPSEAYKLMLSTAADSAGDFTIFTAYAFVPGVAKWKLIGTVKLAGYNKGLSSPATYWYYGKNDTMRPEINQEWQQRPNGSWFNLLPGNLPAPDVNMVSHIDSTARVTEENAIIQKAIATGKTEVKENTKGVYYKILNEGTGRPVLPTDTVQIFYKGYLFPDGEVFDQTAETTRRFPLNRLIQGWQIGLPLLKTGGKIKLVIPSHLAYGIRTRSPKIPPNSILVFEIEVVN
jgi:hypothetical protein